MTTERILSQEQYHGLIKELTRTDGYLLLHKKLIAHLGGFIALVLSNYVDKHIYFEKKNPAANGWFFLTLDQQQQQLGVPRTFLIKYKKICVELGFLKIERRGIPSKEWFKLDYEKLAFIYLHEAKKDMIAPDLSGRLCKATSGRQAKANRSGLVNSQDKCQAEANLRSLYKENIFKENKENINSINTISVANKLDDRDRFKRTKFSYMDKKDKSNPKKEIVQKEDKSIPYKPLATQLSDIIQTNKSITHTPGQIKAWAKELQKLESQNKITIPRMQNAMTWYSHNISELYVPVIESGKSFREKFIKLEAAIERSEQRPFKKSQNTIGTHNIKNPTGAKIDYTSRVPAPVPKGF